MADSRIRVLHCPTSTGGNPQGLAAAERRLGLDSRAVIFEQNHLMYPTDEVLWEQTDPLPLREAKRWHLLWHALRDVEFVHFNYGQTIMPHVTFRQPSGGWKDWLFIRAGNLYASLLQYRDLPLLKRAGIGIAVTYQGDDARQGDYCQAHFPISMTQEKGQEWYSPDQDEYRRWAIQMVDRYADAIYALNPDLMHVLPARTRFMAYASVDPDEWLPPPGSGGGNSRPVVLHAPTHRGGKGTRFVVEAVRQLQAEGVEFEFALVEKLSHAEARRLYARADLVIDQLLAGWYGALAVELMAMGKPVICYLREGDLHFLPPAMRRDLPLIQAEPATIYQVLKRWLTERRQELPALGARSREFVVAHHHPMKIAAGLKDDYMAILRQKGRLR